VNGDAIKRVTEALEARDSRRAGHDWQCPAHDDRKPSLSVTQGASGVLLHCQAGCETQRVVEALGLTLGDLFDERNGNGNGRRIVETYPYTDENGELLYEVVRFEPKDFRPRLPDGTYGMRQAPRVLYRLPTVIEQARRGGRVYVVEGEKDVHAIEKAGGVATCNPGGALKWGSAYSRPLKGAEVVVVADRDEPGRRHAQKVAADLTGIAKSVQIVEAAAGKDAADHLRAGYTLDDLRSPQAAARKDAAPATDDDATAELSEVLALPSVGLAITGVDLYGRGSSAIAQLHLSDGQKIELNPLGKFGSPAKLTIELAIQVGATPALKAPLVARAMALIHRIAAHHEAMTREAIAIDWGLEFLQSAQTHALDMANQEDRWRAFRALADIDPVALSRSDGRSVARTSIVLVDRGGVRYVRCGWFLSFVRGAVGPYSSEDLAREMQSVGWRRPGGKGRMKATSPSSAATLQWNFYAVPSDWGTE
jgi:5S rRNA maturation endonuclease (ribonuclease M5)